MEFDPQDRKVVELLTKLKDANESYPSDMLAARRRAFLNNMAEAGMGAGMGFHRTVKSGSGSGAAPITAGALLEIALLVAIVVEASVLAYFYRDKVADVFRSISATSKIQEIASPPVITSPFPKLEISEVLSSAIPISTASEIPTSTPIPGIPDDLTIINNDAATLTGSAPDPNANHGSHFGKTPKPDGTKKSDPGHWPTKVPKDEDSKPTELAMDY